MLLRQRIRHRHHRGDHRRHDHHRRDHRRDHHHGDHHRRHHHRPRCIPLLKLKINLT